MYLASRARKLINNVERAGLECVHIIADARDEAENKPAATAAPCCVSEEEDIVAPEVKEA
jgi:hypothetical protein